MANEITLTAYFQYAVSGKTYVDQRFVALPISQANFGMCNDTATVVSTGEQTLAVGAIGTAGYSLFVNLDPVNFVRIGTATGQYTIKLSAGQIALLPLAVKTLYAIADTASVKIAYWILEA